MGSAQMTNEKTSNKLGQRTKNLSQQLSQEREGGELQK